MRTKLYTTKPDDIEFTLQVTMSLKHWKELRDAIKAQWPGWDFRAKITDMIYAADKVFVPETPPPLTPQDGE